MNETDIVPELKTKIDTTFKDLIENDEVLSFCLDKLTDKSATWIDADTYAHQIGNLTSKALLEHVSSDILPDGTMYFNIGDRLVTPMLKKDYQMISNYCVAAQEALNEGANLAIKGQTAPFNADRAKGIIDRLSSQPFEDVEWLLKAPIEVFCDSVKADHLEANAKFHAKAGLSPKIIRKTDGKCCKWCTQKAGTYTYTPNMDRDVFRKHENCNCTVEYDPADGSKKKQDVWTKQWESEAPNKTVDISVSGARILDPNSLEAEEWAKSQYDQIRKRTTDCAKIANKYGYTLEEVEAIKDYLFFSGGYIDEFDGEWHPFDPDAAIAQSWYRLSNDKECLPHDITLLKHEILEMKIKETNPGIDHNEAHARAEAMYNYSKESEDYYAERKKRFDKKREIVR